MGIILLCSLVALVLFFLVVHCLALSFLLPIVALLAITTLFLLGYILGLASCLCRTGSLLVFRALIFIAVVFRLFLDVLHLGRLTLSTLCLFIASRRCIRSSTVVLILVLVVVLVSILVIAIVLVVFATALVSLITTRPCLLAVFALLVVLGCISFLALALGGLRPFFLLLFLILALLATFKRDLSVRACCL